jgi:hypothetical protein
LVDLPQVIVILEVTAAFTVAVADVIWPNSGSFGSNGTIQIVSVGFVKNMNVNVHVNFAIRPI